MFAFSTEAISGGNVGTPRLPLAIASSSGASYPEMRGMGQMQICYVDISKPRLQFSNSRRLVVLFGCFAARPFGLLLYTLSLHCSLSFSALPYSPSIC